MKTSTRTTVVSLLAAVALITELLHKKQRL